ncbi:MAG: hypothetical protein IIT67_03345 [Clostridia bacterium]|nr:hypothetical protein [Clostridia bacterium]
MTPEQFIPFWNALTINERNRIKENLQTAANPGSGFFSSKRFMRGGIVFLLQGNLRIFLSSDEGREITAMTMKAGENFLVHPGDASHNRKGQLRYETLKTANTPSFQETSWSRSWGGARKHWNMCSTARSSFFDV